MSDSSTSNVHKTERMQLIDISHIKIKVRHGVFSICKSPREMPVPDTVPGVRVTKQQDTKQRAWVRKRREWSLRMERRAWNKGRREEAKHFGIN